ncbi:MULTISPECIES: hypothetical protein [unclassified Corallococcus]|uniref:hypothetical protein n=1 Tax=unclassified Corallococcus TaxID=2685029 RepID=UPI001A8FB6D5|nr:MULTISPECIES: hypothetical protein [unclassified Corallococcus]MBN9682604.1 hypothetical protein [Corallococcus sp. NCSPR001]WAS85850.1 hypothetical protein O0N60_02485 [Corallococcus sp. NCRR]
MGNASGRQKQKPLILGPAPGAGMGAYAVAFDELEDRELATLKESKSPDTFYLPWKSGDVTEGEIDLSTGTLTYFFTANLSGCSLWYKFQEGRIFIRHEARTDSASQNLHKLAGFKCVVDSSLNPDDIQLSVDQETMVRRARYYVVYALFDYEARQVEFRAQLVAQQTNLVSRQESYDLVKVSSSVVKFPKL